MARARGGTSAGGRAPPPTVAAAAAMAVGLPRTNGLPTAALGSSSNVGGFFDLPPSGSWPRAGSPLSFFAIQPSQMRTGPASTAGSHLRANMYLQAGGWLSQLGLSNADRAVRVGVCTAS